MTGLWAWALSSWASVSALPPALQHLYHRHLQELAGISIFSAWGFRLIEFLVCFVVLSLFLISYCRKIKRAPSKSVMPNFLEEQQQEQKIMSERVPMTARRIATLVVLLLAFVGQAVGAVQFGWDMEDISGLYIIVAVVVAIINGINPSKVCVDFIKAPPP